LYSSGKGSRDGSEDKDNSEKNTCSKLIAHRSKSETQENRSCYTTDTGGPQIELRQTKSLTDLWKKRGGGEPDEESNEEIPPRAVESTHVWSGKGAKLDFDGFVILLGIDLECVGLVLFGFGSLYFFQKNAEE